ncbi:hypothetical protein BASA62_004490 [Batrachochytrium salamandrivorans]|nr:hypothetical protein BASA62_004490 [Batrachochytrium salamandrivorans]
MSRVSQQPRHQRVWNGKGKVPLPSEDAVVADHTNEPITEMQRHTVEVIKDTQQPIQKSSNATKTGPSSKQTKNK